MNKGLFRAAKNDDIQNQDNDHSNFCYDEYVRDLEKKEIKEKEDGYSTAVQFTKKYRNKITEYMGKYPLSAIDCLSVNVDNIPEEVRGEILRYQYVLRELIEKINQRVIDQRYKPIEASIESMEVSYNNRMRRHEMIRAEKSFNVSCQSLRVTAEVFSKINSNILEEMAEVEKSGESLKFRSLLVGNAILVYELADFIIAFIDSFKYRGLNQIRRCHQEALSTIAEVRRELKELRKIAESDNMDGRAQHHLSGIEAREKAMDRTEEEWNSYMAGIGTIEEDIALFNKNLPYLKFVRSNALTQIKALEVITITQVVKSNLLAFDAAIGNLLGIELAVLSSDRVDKLLNIP